MTDISNEEIEGRLVAQREVLGLVLALLARQTDAGERFWDELEGRAAFQNQQEDPGALPTGAFATQAALMREYRLIVEEARGRFAEGKEKPWEKL
ncbi:hypothetical protein [Phyllobacterium salinisoli]|nr:hypothetical protein [Phyllobacterium salinisoli]